MILLLLLAESLMIALIGGALGCGAAYHRVQGCSRSARWPRVRSPASGCSPAILAETLVIAALIGVLSALVPAHSAARRNIVDALQDGGLRWPFR